MANSLVVKLNGVIATHYPEGNVDYPEAIRNVVAVAAAYQRMLRKISNAEAAKSPAQVVAIQQLVETVALALDSAGFEAEAVRQSQAQEVRRGLGRHSALVDVGGQPFAPDRFTKRG